MGNNETIQTASTKTIQTASTETSNQTAEADNNDTKKKSTWQKKLVIALACVLWMSGLGFGLAKYVQKTNDQILDDLLDSKKIEETIKNQNNDNNQYNQDETNSTIADNKTNEWNGENAQTGWGSDWDDEDFSCLREKPQWDSRLNFLESQYTNNDHEGIMRFNNDGDDDNIPSVEDAGEILKGTKRDIINLVVTSNLLTEENIKALEENSNIKKIKTNNGIISKEEFLKELKLFKEAYAQI